ncbi:MAG: DNA starvation/stationary phase protection protein [Saprospiraceae bacterium]|nr:DNA starvation/stationary phase protection protein [Saprospiraceae bacterium]
MNYLGLDEGQTAKVSKELNTLLSCYHVYYQNLRSFHWHVEGQNFFDMHNLFEEMYNDAKIKIDEIAERILTIRYKPISTLSAYLKYSKVEEAKAELSDQEMIDTVLENHKQIIHCMRDTLQVASESKDEGTIDLIAGFLADLEKRSWMLDAWSSKKFKMEMA